MDYTVVFLFVSTACVLTCANTEGDFDLPSSSSSRGKHSTSQFQRSESRQSRTTNHERVADDNQNYQDVESEASESREEIKNFTPIRNNGESESFRPTDARTIRRLLLSSGPKHGTPNLASADEMSESNPIIRRSSFSEGQQQHNGTRPQSKNSTSEKDPSFFIHSFFFYPEAENKTVRDSKSSATEEMRNVVVPSKSAQKIRNLNYRSRSPGSNQEFERPAKTGPKITHWKFIGYNPIASAHGLVARHFELRPMQAEPRHPGMAIPVQHSHPFPLSPSLHEEYWIHQGIPNALEQSLLGNEMSHPRIPFSHGYQGRMPLVPPTVGREPYGAPRRPYVTPRQPYGTGITRGTSRSPTPARNDKPPILPKFGPNTRPHAPVGYHSHYSSPNRPAPPLKNTPVLKDIKNYDMSSEEPHAFSNNSPADESDISSYFPNDHSAYDGSAEHPPGSYKFHGPHSGEIPPPPGRPYEASEEQTPSGYRPHPDGPYGPASYEQQPEKPKSFKDTLPPDYREEIEKNAELFIKQQKAQNASSPANRSPYGPARPYPPSYSPPHSPHPSLSSTYSHTPSSQTYSSRSRPSASLSHSYSPPSLTSHSPPPPPPPSSYSSEPPPDTENIPNLRELEQQAEIESSKKKKNRVRELILEQDHKTGQWKVSKDSQIPKENVFIPDDAPKRPSSYGYPSRGYSYGGSPATYTRPRSNFPIKAERKPGTKAQGVPRYTTVSSEPSTSVIPRKAPLRSYRSRSSNRQAIKRKSDTPSFELRPRANESSFLPDLDDRAIADRSDDNDDEPNFGDEALDKLLIDLSKENEGIDFISENPRVTDSESQTESGVQSSTDFDEPEGNINDDRSSDTEDVTLQSDDNTFNWDNDRHKGLKGNFQYANNPDVDVYEYGFRAGNPKHKTEIAHQTVGPFSRTELNWEDAHGNYGEHIWEYNHTDDEGDEGTTDATKKA